MTHKTDRCRALWVGCLAACFLQMSDAAVWGATNTWLGVVSTNWSDAANWSTGEVPGATTNDIVRFDDPASVPNLPFLDTAQPTGTGSIYQFLFEKAGWTVGGTQVVTFASRSAPLNVSVTSLGQGTNTIIPTLRVTNLTAYAISLNIASNNTLVTQGSVTKRAGLDSLNLTMYGPGTWRIQKLVAVGDFILAGGTTEMECASGDAVSAGFTFRPQGGNIVLLRDDQMPAKTFRIGNGSVVDLNGYKDTIDNLSACDDNANMTCTILTGTNTLTLGGSSPVVRGGGYQIHDRNRTGTAVINGNIALPASAKNWVMIDQTVGSPRSTVQWRINAAVSGAGCVFLQGDGTLELNGTNTYSGATSITRATVNSVNFNAGRLIVNGGATALASGTGSGPVTNGVGGTLCGFGTLGPIGRTGRTLTVFGDAGLSNIVTKSTSGATVTNAYSNLSTVSPGGISTNNTSLIGTLRVNGDVALMQYSRLAIDLGGAASNDCLAVNGQVDVSLNGTVLDLSLASGAKLTESYTLLTCGALVGRFSSVVYQGVPVSEPTAWRAIGGTHQLVYKDNAIRLVPSSGTLVVFQ